MHISIFQVRDHTESVIAEIIAYSCLQEAKKIKKIIGGWDAKTVICWEIRTKADETVTCNLTRVTWVHLCLSQTHVHLSGAFLRY